MTTHCRTIQLLEPDPYPDLTVVDPEAALATEEGGTLTLQVGVTEYEVEFGTAKLNAAYDFIEDDISSTDPDPLIIGYSMPNDLRTVNGFTLQLDSEPDTANYRFNWKVRVPTV